MNHHERKELDHLMSTIDVTHTESSRLKKGPLPVDINCLDVFLTFILELTFFFTSTRTG